jgi:hypothetical protein
VVGGGAHESGLLVDFLFITSIFTSIDRLMRVYVYNNNEIIGVANPGLIVRRALLRITMQQCPAGLDSGTDSFA